MAHLLIVAHGSRRQASNVEIKTMAEKADKISQQFKKVSHAFLELSTPSIPDGIRDCITNGAKKVVVLPCFLSAGRHVATDIPEEVKIVQNEYPNIEIIIAPYLGTSDDLINLILNLAKLA